MKDFFNPKRIYRAFKRQRALNKQWEKSAYRLYRERARAAERGEKIKQTKSEKFFSYLFILIFLGPLIFGIFDSIIYAIKERELTQRIKIYGKVDTPIELSKDLAQQKCRESRDQTLASFLQLSEYENYSEINREDCVEGYLTDYGNKKLDLKIGEICGVNGRLSLIKTKKIPDKASVGDPNWNKPVKIEFPVGSSFYKCLGYEKNKKK